MRYWEGLSGAARLFRDWAEGTDTAESAGLICLREDGCWVLDRLPNSIKDPDKRGFNLASIDFTRSVLGMAAEGFTGTMILVHSHPTGLRPSRSDCRWNGEGTETHRRVNEFLPTAGFETPMLYMVVSEATGRWGLYRLERHASYTALHYHWEKGVRNV